ncbi:MAG: metallophosphoesterase [Patescibacteria group bacterium]|nr:metallophosphoesterase [Patescibacteria group bacterium]
MDAIIYDIVIVAVTAAVPLFLIELKCRWPKMRTKGPYVLAGAVLSVVWLVIVYGSFIEPRMLAVRQQEVVLGDGDGRLRMVLVSDTHLGRYRHHDWMDKLVDRVNLIEPDVVVLLGDIVDQPTGLRDLAPLGRLESRFGMYAVLGNTDYSSGAVSARHGIENYGEVLTNESVLLGDTGVRLAGIDDIWYGTPDWDRAFADVQEDDVVILAAHNPDAVSRAEYYGADLVVAGHTHGGQIRLPLIGPGVELPTEIGQRYDQGLFSFGQTRLYITSGAGESGPRARLLNPPEIVVLEVVY